MRRKEKTCSTKILWSNIPSPPITSLFYLYIYDHFCVINFFNLKKLCSDYRRLDEHDQYESLGLDDSLEDERDLDQIIADRRAAELELEARDGQMSINPSRKKLPQLLHDQGKLFLSLFFLHFFGFLFILI